MKLSLVRLILVASAVSALLRLEAQGTEDGAKRLVRDKAVADNASDFNSRSAKIALLVGIDDYDRDITGLPPLKYPISDVTDFERELRKQGYLVKTLVDRQATASTIKEEILQLGKALDPGKGTFLFVFSGHGFSDGGDNYLATYGTNISEMKDRGLAVSEVEKLLKKTGAKQQVAFIDACRSDPATKGADKPRTFNDLADSDGLRVLYSTAPGDVSYEDDTFQHGIFSYYLLKGLQGEASGGADGFITFDDLQTYVTQQMRSYSVNKGRTQRPYAHGENSGDFLIAKRLTPVPPVAPTLIPPNLPAPPAGGQFSADRLQIEFGESVKLRWKIPGATSVRIQFCYAICHAGFESLPADGEVTVSPKENTEFLLTSDGSEPSPLHVTVKVLPHIKYFDAPMSKIDQCNDIPLRWDVEGATKASLSPSVGAVKAGPGYQLVKLAATTKFVLTAEGPGGVSQREFTVTVTPGTKTCATK
ncbi:MAG TPA: caspase family protein [Bryobacteraceae bacterium]|jgi:hypothetical protein